MSDKKTSSNETPRRNSAETSGEKPQAENTASKPSSEAEPRLLSYAFLVDHTPPPIFITDGSLAIETELEFAPVSNVGMKKRYVYSGNPVRRIAQLKIVNDAADTLYRNAEALNKMCEVRIWLERDDGAPDIVIDNDETNNIRFEIDKQIELTPREPLPGSRPRGSRYQHPGFGMGDFQIRKIEVFGKLKDEDANRVTLFMAVPEDDESVTTPRKRKSAIMIWTVSR